MEAIIKEMGPKLKEQLADLANQIRQAETNVFALKEGYLKVQGALELLEIFQKEEQKMNEAEAISEVL
jgi:hypothetical protein